MKQINTPEESHNGQHPQATRDNQWANRICSCSAIDLVSTDSRSIEAQSEHRGQGRVGKRRPVPREFPSRFRQEADRAKEGERA